MTKELKVLVEAHDMLDAKTSELLHGPIAFFSIALHARDHVNNIIKAYLREPEYTHDGEGREIPGGPVTLAEACEAGIALFE